MSKFRSVCAVIGILAVGLGAGSAQAQKVWTPKAGSAERQAVLDAARAPVEKDLRQSVLFELKTLRVTPQWAFVWGKPVRPDGRPVDYARSIYGEQSKSGAFDNAAAVLLVRTEGGWSVVTYSVGFTDEVWETWDEEFGAPAWLWP